MRRNLAFVLLLFHAFIQSAWADEVILNAIPNAQKVGEGRLSVLLWDVYDAVLYAPHGQWSETQPFALSLHYLRDIQGTDIADRSIQEMRGLGMNDEDRLAQWHGEMQTIFPNVKNGTVLTALFIPGKPTEFFEHQQHIGSIGGDAFRRWFSGIWLSEQTSEPTLRRKLLSLRNANPS